MYYLPSSPLITLSVFQLCGWLNVQVYFTWFLIFILYFTSLHHFLLLVEEFFGLIFQFSNLLFDYVHSVIWPLTEYYISMIKILKVVFSNCSFSMVLISSQISLWMWIILILASLLILVLWYQFYVFLKKQRTVLSLSLFLCLISF